MEIDFTTSCSAGESASYLDKLETEQEKQQKQLQSLAKLKNLSICDEEFVYNIKCDIERYLKKRRINCVLLFPPVNNYRRFLIHQTCEHFRQKYDLFTFSVGQGISRRTVVCFKNQLLDPIKYTVAVANSAELKQSHVKSWRSVPKPENVHSKALSLPVNSNLNLSSKMGVEKKTNSDHVSHASSKTCVDIYRPPALRYQTNEPEYCNGSETKSDTVTISVSCNNSPIHPNETKTCNTMTSSDADILTQSHQHTPINRRERRPDRAVYVPRPRRSQTTPPATKQVASNNANEQQLGIALNSNDSVSAVQPLKTDDLSKGSLKNKKVTSVGKEDRKDRLKKQNKRIPPVDLEEQNNVVVISSKQSECSISDDYTKQTIGIEKETVTKITPTDYKTVLSSDNFLSSRETLTKLPEQNSDTLEMDLLNKMSNRNDISMADNRNNAKEIIIEDVIAVDRVLPKCDIEEQELQRASKEINRSNRRIMKQTFVSQVLEIPDKIENAHEPESVEKESKIQLNSQSKIQFTSDEEDEDDWENMYDESGDCLDPKVIEELAASVGKVKIELPKMDYGAYLTKQSILNAEEFPHVLEVSNFPVEFKNQDLLMVFSQYKESGFDIKWVDDTHALAVFSSSRIAAEVLTMGHPFVVLKPLTEATAESRLKAKKCAASLQPYRPRPETCAALARRLVTGALGVRLKTAAAERENEKRVLREAKERKLLAAKQRDEVWES